MSRMHSMRCAGIVVGTCAFAHATFAAIMVTGSVYPNPIPVDGIVTGELQVGVAFQSTGQVDVTAGDTLTTQDRTFLSYTVAASGTVNVTDATWNAEGGVFLAGQFGGKGYVNLNNATWNVTSNVAFAQGDISQVGVTLEGGSTWELLFGANIAKGVDCKVDINLNDGEWLAHTLVTVGPHMPGYRAGVGSIYLRANGILTAEYGLVVEASSRVLMGGGLLSLAGESTLAGALHSDPNAPNDPNDGGIVRVNIGQVAGGTGLVNVGPDVDLENIAVELVFHPEVTPDPLLVYDAFDAIDGGDLPTILATADSISTPIDWALNQTTGELSFIALVDALSGPDVPASAMRQAAYDSDADTDIDLVDVAFHQLAVGG